MLILTRIYIRDVNIWIVAFTLAYLYWEILILTCVLHTLCKRMDCRIYMGIFTLGNISINLGFYIRYVYVWFYRIYNGIFISGNININLRFYIGYVGERGGSVVECRTPEREVRGSRPTAAVLCPWARHFTPRKYWLITQEAMAPSRHDWKIVDWDVKPQHNQQPTNQHRLCKHTDFRIYIGTFILGNIKINLNFIYGM